MIRMPIRARLALWYALFFAAALALFAVAAIVLMRHSIVETVDEQLSDEAEAVRWLVTQSGGALLADQVREHSELQAGSSLLQVSDENGNFIYRSPGLQKLGVPVSALQGFTTLQFGKTPLRILTRHAASNGRTVAIQVAQDMDDYVEATARYEQLVLLGIPVLLAAAALGGLWISRRALSPVDDITRAAQNIHANDLSCRLAVPGTNDELQRLAETLNSMLARIESAFHRIAQFTADASHELRTPVSLIRTRAEIALRKPRPGDEYRQSLLEILADAEQVSALIENLMLLARSDAGAEALQFQRTDLCEITRRVCAQSRVLAESHGLSWSESMAGSPVWVGGDESALRRLLLIVTENAIKYTPDGGNVRVLLSKENGNAYVEVTDSGIGISAQDLPHIFERFYRADVARSRDSGGVGLGLSIARWIARAHHGDIAVQSTPGSGSSFRITMPLVNGAAAGAFRKS